MSFSPVRLLLPPALGAVVAAAIVFVFPPMRITPWGQVFACAVVVLSLWSVVDHFTRPDRPPLPFVPAIGVFYAVFFGIPALTLGVVWPNPGQPLMSYFYQPALTLAPEPSVNGLDGFNTGACLLGMAVLMGPLRFLPARLAWLPHVRLGRTASPRRLLLTAWTALAVHFIGMLLPSVWQFPGATQVVVPLGTVGFGIFWVFFLRGELSWPVAVVVLLLLLPLRLILGLASGSLTPAFMIVVAFAFLTAAARPRMLLLLGVAVILLAGAYRPVLGYRTLIWGADAPPNAGVLERIALLPTGLKKGWQWVGSPSGPWDQGGGQGGLAREVLRRVNQVVVLAVVMRRTPDDIPYWEGHSLKNLATGMIPRILWPSKGLERIGNEFGHRYGFLIDSENNMAVNLPWLIEGYANFGWVGLVMVMGGVGLVLAFLERLFNHRGTAADLALGTAILLPLANQESNISLTMGSLIQVSLFLALFLAVMLDTGRLLRLFPFHNQA